MDSRKWCLPALALAAVALTAGGAYAIGFILAESKEQLKLKYDLTVADSGDGRVTIRLAIADEGRLKPLDSIELGVPKQDGSGGYDLHMKLAPKKIDGKLVVEALLKKDLAARAQLWLTTTHLDGKQLEDRNHFVIPIAKHLPRDDAKKP